MTAIVAFVLGLATAAIYTHICWWRAWRRWVDQHDYNKVRLEVTRVDLLYRDKDHNERLARRWQHRALIAREHVGDLTIQLHRARHRRPVIPAYGPHREVPA